VIATGGLAGESTELRSGAAARAGPVGGAGTPPARQLESLDRPRWSHDVAASPAAVFATGTDVFPLDALRSAGTIDDTPAFAPSSAFRLDPFDAGSFDPELLGFESFGLKSAGFESAGFESTDLTGAPDCGAVG